MAFTLYDATVPSFLQVLGSVSRLVDKAEGYAGDNGLDADALIQARLAEDMLPFGYQVKSAAGHSLGAIEGVRKGVFSPDLTPWPDSFAGLRDLVARAIAGLQAVDADEVVVRIGSGRVSAADYICVLLDQPAVPVNVV